MTGAFVPRTARPHLRLISSNGADLRQLVSVRISVTTPPAPIGRSRVFRLRHRDVAGLAKGGAR
jgi:hypothetical protein